MRKYLFLLMVSLLSLNASAQFEKGKVYFSGSIPAAGIAYSDAREFSLGLDLQGGYFFADNWALISDVGFDFSSKRWNDVFVGAKARYYILQNGLFLGLGTRYLHEYKNFNDLQLSPEIGYCFFLNRHISIEPSAYYNMSMTEFAKKSEVGIRIGLGIYLDK
mgnify:CR=1 FL=1